ncbi:acyl-CoA dehydrogenase family protein [uncultured Salinicola sp.]|uniref:acyl-CoA dehydrogenase family protein n=1 Tax=uncultured Salinicola sp. TaxID=1193542 RepID=UPI002610FF03|nr:acyl-CoA dehydrogenase family protein [uncultured Salinicola sp.]
MSQTTVAKTLPPPDSDSANWLPRLTVDWPCPAADPESLARRLRHLVASRLDRLDLPAQGKTLARWQHLSDIAALDLGLAKLFEGHTDALAILAEISQPSRYPATARWGVWAAEPPFARLTLRRASERSGALVDGNDVVLDGTKAWCSGAHAVTHALVTGWLEETPCLAAVELSRPGVQVTQRGWSAVGMAATASVEIEFENVEATLVGDPGAYLRRPGFWQGGIGVAACWWGGARRIAETLLAGANPEDPHRLAHLGMVEVALHNGASRLREAAAWVDAHPQENARLLALSVRAAIDDMVATIIEHAGRALGAAPYCRDAAFARMMADLPVFVRQTHAERDLESIGRDLLQRRQENKATAPGDVPSHHGWRLMS